MSWKAAGRRASVVQKETEVAKKFKISGPGAADFIGAPGGLDLPETDPSKGMTQTREEGIVDDVEQLEPNLEPPDPPKKTTL
jgi:hypothetical protein